MVIYADILIVVNTIIDYFILLLTAKISKCHYRSSRIVLGSVAGGISSVYIFLPQQPFLIELAVKFIFSIIIIVIAFGYIKIKVYFRNVFTFLMTGFIYAGLIMMIWTTFKPNGIFINNSVVYYDISAVLLIVFSVLTYLIITVIMSLTRREAIRAARCVIEIECDQNRLSLNGIFDTGNSVKDVFSSSDVLFVGDDAINKLFGTSFENVIAANRSRYRIIPCKTVNGDGFLEGIRCDKANIIFENKKSEIHKPIIIKSQTEFKDDFDVILNPEILTRME